MKKILHIITGIGTGGAERVLYNLTYNDKTNQHIVVSLKKKNFIKTSYDFNFLKIIYLDLNLYNFLYKFFLLSFIIFKIKPTIVQTWMYHADFFGGLAGKLVSTKCILWNIRNSNLHKSTKLTTKLILKINILLSYFIPDKIISCSQNAIKIHKKLGYRENFIFIPNGINVQRKFYSQNKYYKDYIFKKYFLISYVGRWHPQKDFSTLFKSLKILKFVFGQFNWKLLVSGYELEKINSVLYKLIRDYSLEKEVILYGQTSLVNQIYQISDINILSSSHGEAFPNVILESMANGTPCVATDVGECRNIILNYGWCVPVERPIKLALAIRDAINLKKNIRKWNSLKLNCKTSIKNRYSLNKMILNYNNLWDRYI